MKIQYQYSFFVLRDYKIQTYHLLYIHFKVIDCSGLTQSYFMRNPEFIMNIS